MVHRCIAAAVVCLALAIPARARGEYLRFELGAASERGVPQTFEALRERVIGLRWPITWEDPPYFDPYSVGGGATYASITFEYDGDSITVTWTEFAELAVAAQQEQDFTASYGNAGWVRFAREGRVFVQAYSNDGEPERAGEALRAIVGG